MFTEEILSEDQKFFSFRELQDAGLSQYNIAKLVREGKLRKLNKNYYENNGYCGDESDFYYAGIYAPQGVICLLSAAVYYNITTYIPDAVDVAIPRKSRVSTKPDWPQLYFHYYTDDRYMLGIREIKQGKNGFRIYDMDKTVVDIVFYKEKVGVEETKEILTTYLKREDRNLNRLLKYAEQMKCSDVMRNYLEVLV